jgi:hypothetical protein
MSASNDDVQREKRELRLENNSFVWFSSSHASDIKLLRFFLALALAFLLVILHTCMYKKL